MTNHLTVPVDSPEYTTGIVASPVIEITSVGPVNADD